jgi:hypothetical protein
MIFRSNAQPTAKSLARLMMITSYDLDWFSNFNFSRLSEDLLKSIFSEYLLRAGCVNHFTLCVLVFLFAAS